MVVSVLQKHGFFDLADTFNYAVDKICSLYEDLWSLNEVMAAAQSRSDNASTQFSSLVLLWRWAATEPSTLEPVRTVFRRRVREAIQHRYGLQQAEDVLDIHWPDPVLLGLTVDPVYGSFVWLRECLAGIINARKITNFEVTAVAQTKLAFFRYMRAEETRQRDAKTRSHTPPAASSCTTTTTTTTTTSVPTLEPTGPDEPPPTNAFSLTGFRLAACGAADQDIDDTHTVTRSQTDVIFNNYRFALKTMRDNPSYTHLFSDTDGGPEAIAQQRIAIFQDISSKGKLDESLRAFIARLLAVPKVSVLSEVAFSIAGILDSRRRQSMDVDRFAKILFLHYNYIDVARTEFPREAARVAQLARAKSTHSISPALHPQTLKTLRSIGAKLGLGADRDDKRARKRTATEANDDVVEIGSEEAADGAVAKPVVVMECEETIGVLNRELEEESASESFPVLDLLAEMEAMRGGQTAAPRLLDDFDRV